MDIGDWLRSLGLERYEQVFRDNEVDERVLPKLTTDDLKELGVSAIGHRRLLLEAIAALRADAGTKQGASSPPTDAAEPPRSATGAERRQLTVMFCDLVGSTQLSTSLDAEDLREVIGAYHRCVTETVTAFAGFVAKYMGDGVLVYFGYPKAREDDAERAVRAGLALIERVDQIRAPQPLQVRVGLATGLVVVGDLIGFGASQERAVVGETPNLAARLQGLALPSALLIDTNTRRLVGDLFEFRDFGSVEAKGFFGAVPAWQVLRPSTVESRFEALRASSLTPLVGREEELAFLLRRWTRSKEGQGQVVLVSGEAGIGKSRIAAVLADRLSREPSLRLRYFCSPQYENSALHPVTAQLERAAGFNREDPPSTRLEKLRTLLAQSAATDEEVALIGELLSLLLPDSAATAGLTPQRKKEKTLQALVRQMEVLSGERPLLMLWEDVHWIDPTSRELLDLIIARVSSIRVLLIITFRPEFEAPWTGQAYVGSLSLGRLNPQDGTALVERVAGNSMPPAIAARIVTRADGIPLFVEELTRALIETGIQRDEAAHADPEQPALLAIPPTLHASLLARLDRLGPEAKSAAQIGAAIGREFSYRLVAAAAGHRDNELRRSLDQLVKAGLVFRRGEPPHATYLFKHALVQDAAYGSLLRGPRRELHARIAITLEQELSAIIETPAELIARHWADAGEAERAISYWLKAAERSINRSAMAEAQLQLEKGLNLLSGAADEVDRQRHELRLQVALWVVLMTARGPATEETGRVLLRAREISEALGETRGLPQIMCGQWSFYAHAGELSAAQSEADGLLAFGVEHHDPAAITVARFETAWNSFVKGNAAAALAGFRQGGDGAARSEILEILGFDDAITAAAYSALAYFCLGQVDRAMAQSDTAVGMARELSHPATGAVTYSIICRFLWLSRNYRILKLRSSEFRALMTAYGFAFWRTQSELYRGWFLVEDGSTEKGLALLSASLTAYRSSGNKRWLPFLLAIYAEACRKASQLKPALSALVEATRVTEESDERWFEPELERMRGEILIASGTRNVAEPHLEKAVRLARDQSAKTWELRAATSLARLWREHGRTLAAYDLLAPIYGWFTEGFGTPDLKEAKALLDELA